jgi:hypothetical protein
MARACRRLEPDGRAVRLRRLAISAQVKYTVRVPGELAFSEFRGGEAWQSIPINRYDTAVAMNRYEGIVDTFV